MFYLWYQMSRSRVGNTASYSNHSPETGNADRIFIGFLIPHIQMPKYNAITAALHVLSSRLLTIHPTVWIFICACATAIVVQNKQNALRCTEMETVFLPISVAIHLGVTDSYPIRALIILLVHIFCVVMPQSFWCAETPRKVSCCMSRPIGFRMRRV
jgi:hypothetical protein